MEKNVRIWEIIKIWKIRIKESRKSEKETFNNKKGPYYRIEKLPKEDKGEKGMRHATICNRKKNLKFNKKNF